MPADAQDIVRRWTSLRDHRKQWDDYYQELAEVLHPVRADFTTQPLEGQKRNVGIYDGLPMVARRGLATAIDGLLKPKTSKWFTLRTSDEELNQRDDVKAWLRNSEERMYRALYARSARFIQKSGAVDNDLVTFGSAVLFIGVNRRNNGLSFDSIHLRDAFFAENGDGVVDRMYERIRISARQAADRWGKENLGRTINEALSSNREFDKFEFIRAVYPREDRDTGRLDNGNMPFASVVVNMTEEEVVAESGFMEFPYAVPRWETASGEYLGRSPGMMALPDAKTLQAMGKTMLVAGQKAVDPPMWALDDSVISAIRTFPAGVTIIDAEAVRGIGSNPIGVLEMGKQLPIGRELQQDIRVQVEAAFFKNVFSLPVDGPQMTATEVLERKDEFVRTLGPVFGQLEADYIAPIPRRIFGIMMRARAFMPMPDAMRNARVRFEFVSPIERARKQIEAAGMAKSFELLMPLAELQPQIFDNFDGDEIARSIPETFGAPLSWIRSKETVAAVRKRREDMRRAQQLAELADKGADATLKASKARQTNEQ